MKYNVSYTLSGIKTVEAGDVEDAREQVENMGFVELATGYMDSFDVDYVEPVYANSDS